MHDTLKESHSKITKARIKAHHDIRLLEFDLANQVKATDELEKQIKQTEIELYDYSKAIDKLEKELVDMRRERKYWKDKYDNLEIEDIPFSEDTPYVGQTVKVKYGSQIKITQISKILDENPVKYRCYKCGSKKYSASDFMEISGDELVA
jgi:uncharacterized coiled-coil protein SlyX